MAVVTCSCGAKVRVPDGAHGPLRCPRCQSAIDVRAVAVATTSAPSVVSSAIREGEARTCPICQSPISANEPSLECPECHQPHHEECWNEIGGCALYGCKAAPQIEKQADNGPILSAWGDVKNCPMCGEKIKAIALKCRYCDASFDTVDPLNHTDLRNRLDKEKSDKSLRTSAIALFIFSMVGLFAPLMLIISLIWVPLNRKKLKAAGPVLLILGYAAIALSSVFSFLMLFLILSGS